MANNTPGARFLAGLRFGFPELSYLQDNIFERLQFGRTGQAFEPGWVGHYWGDGEDDYGWRLEDGGSGEVRLNVKESGAESPYPLAVQRSTERPYLGYDPLGRALEIRAVNASKIVKEDGDLIVVPDDGVWYTLVARYLLTTVMPGRLNLTGSSVTVGGNRTRFSRLTAATDARATKIRITSTDSTAGNEGLYEIATITDDENMTFVSAPPANENNVPFRVQGEFSGSLPADPDAYQEAIVVWELIGRTVTPPGDALIAYDVMRDTGVSPNINMIDRRQASQFRIINGRNQNVSLNVDARINLKGADPNLEFTPSFAAAIIPGGASRVDMRSAATGSASSVAKDMETGGLLAYLYNSNGIVQVKQYCTVDRESLGSDGWNNPNQGGVVEPVTEVNISDIALEALPKGSGSTHALLWATNAGTIKIKYSADNGATWGLESIIMTPAGGDKVTAIDSVLTKYGRWIVAIAYEISGGDKVIRYIFTDDLGLTWDTNSNAGYDLAAKAGSNLSGPSIAEDEHGNLWTAWTLDASSIRYVRGKDLNDPEPLASEIPIDGWVMQRDKTNTISKRPTFIPLSGGNMAIMFESHDNSPAWDDYYYLNIGYVGHGTTTRLQTPFILAEPTDGDDGSSGDSAYYFDSSGRVRIAILAGYSPTSIPTFTLTPQLMSRPTSWFGGR